MVASDDVGANLCADAAAASLMSLARRPMVNVMSIMENSKMVERNQRQTKGRQAGQAKIVAGKTRASKPPAKGPPNRKDVGSASAQHAVDLGKRPEKSVEFEKPVEAEVIASAKQFSARQQRLMERRKRNAAVMGKKGNALKASNANSRQKADSVSARQTKGQQGEVAKAPQPQPESSGGDKGKKRKMFPPSAMCVDLEHRRATEVARAGSGEKSGAPPENVVDLTIDDDELDIEATRTAKAYNLGSLPFWETALLGRSLGSRLTKRARFVKSDGMIAQMVAKGPRNNKEVQISKLSTEKDLSRACSQMISRLAELHSHLFNGSLEQDCSVVGDQFPSFFVNEEYASVRGPRSGDTRAVQPEPSKRTGQAAMPVSAEKATTKGVSNSLRAAMMQRGSIHSIALLSMEGKEKTKEKTRLASIPPAMMGHDGKNTSGKFQPF